MPAVCGGGSSDRNIGVPTVWLGFFSGMPCLRLTQDLSIFPLLQPSSFTLPLAQPLSFPPRAWSHTIPLPMELLERPFLPMASAPKRGAGTPRKLSRGCAPAPDQPSASATDRGCLSVTITEIVRINNLAGRSFSVSTRGVPRPCRAKSPTAAGKGAALRGGEGFGAALLGGRFTIIFHGKVRMFEPKPQMSSLLVSALPAGQCHTESCLRSP